MTHDLFSGFSQLLTPEAIGLLFAGMAIGMFMGMLPGMGVSLALSLMLPFLYHMSVIPAITLMLATQAASYYAASITAILLNTPGAPESYPTTLDGFPMAKRGEAGRALAISAASTWAGGWIGCVVLVILIPVSGSLVNFFHPPEFAAIIILALVLIGGTGESTSAGKVILSGAIGLMLSFIGSDPVTGVERFTFGNISLMDGLNVVPFALGVFAMTQMVVMFSRNEAVAGGAQGLISNAFRRQVGQGLGDAVRSWVHILRSALVASVLGLIPGIGGFSANFISYSLGRQVSRKYGKQFGTGVPAGVASAEGSSLAKEVGSLVPAVALGLPSGVGMVIFIAALSILGVQPGPTLLKAQPTLPYSMMWVMAIAGLVSCAVGLVITPWLARATNVRGPVMMPVIVSLAVLGSFAAVTGFAGVVELGVFAVIGVVLRKLGYSLAAMTIGLVLGGTFADNLHLTQSIYGYGGFVTKSPLADVFLVIAIALLVLIAWRGHRGRSIVTPERAARGPRSPHPVLEPVAEAVIAVVSLIYMVVALGYAAGAGTLPAIIAAIAAAVALFRLASRGVALLRDRSAGDGSATHGTELGAVVPTADAALAAVPAGHDTGGRDVTGLESAVGREPGPGDTAGHPGALGGDGGDAGPGEGADRELSRWHRRLRTKRELMAIGWIWAAILASYLLGFEIGVPLAAAAYALTSVEWSRWWQRLIYAAVVTGAAFGIAYCFLTLFNFTFAGIWT
ncbi:MAG TPA: tripartite tricarboxylate transporter permease [Trebonia sp.]|jgi:putative tricarboxylic transport membrane protein|nr:tripartite tricarboxylate transporter permease [Trebonia sp.]